MQEVIQTSPSAGLLEEITSHLQKDGFYCLRGAVGADTLQIFQQEIHKLVKEKGERYFSVINACKDAGSPFHALQQSPYLQTFLHELVRLANTGRNVGNDNLSVLRVVTGKNTDGQSLRFHYDATMITALIPVIIPKGALESCGHLLAFKNSRPVRRWSFLNFIEKVLIQNKLSQKLISAFALRKVDQYVHPLEEGNIYFFYGYRTLHANLPVDPSFLRATMLFHFGNPHYESRLIRSIARFRHWRERLNLEFNR